MVVCLEGGGVRFDFYNHLLESNDAATLSYANVEPTLIVWVNNGLITLQQRDCAQAQVDALL